jgi:CubicO group peptidase (beta-lactamase class C family)
VVSADWIQSSLQPRAVVDEERGIEYGYLWWIVPFERGGQAVTAYAMSGNGGNYVFVVPDFGFVAVVTATAYNTSYMHEQSRKILQDYVLSARR